VEINRFRLTSQSGVNLTVLMFKLIMTMVLKIFKFSIW